MLYYLRFTLRRSAIELFVTTNVTHRRPGNGDAVERSAA